MLIEVICLNVLQAVHVAYDLFDEFRSDRGQHRSEEVSVFLRFGVAPQCSGTNFQQAVSCLHMSKAKLAHFLLWYIDAFYTMLLERSLCVECQVFEVLHSNVVVREVEVTFKNK